MSSGLSRDKNISEEKKKRIARKMREGYKKMAPLNQKLAEEYLTRIKDETE